MSKALLAKLLLAASLLCVGAGSVAGQTAEPASAAPSTSAAAVAGRLTFLPGDARAISRASSASRDTALLEGVLYPRISVTFGTEFGLLLYRAGPVSIRPGLFALFNLESRSKAKHLFPAPGGDSDLWRGILGYELTCSFDELASRYLGSRGGLELALGYYHESEHHSASNGVLPEGSPPDHPELRGLPQMNNYTMLDAAVRTSWQKIELLGRLQGKLFLNGPATYREPFRYGVGGDIVVRSRHLENVQPFWSNFAEILSSPLSRDANTFRSLLGLAFPGFIGELSVYLALTVGAGKGLLIPVHDTDLGAGLRYSPFRS